jgi:hypothetical protein
MYPLSTRGGNHPTTGTSLRRIRRSHRIRIRIRHGIGNRNGHRICRTRGIHGRRSVRIRIW